MVILAILVEAVVVWKTELALLLTLTLLQEGCHHGMTHASAGGRLLPDLVVCSIACCSPGSAAALSDPAQRHHHP